MKSHHETAASSLFSELQLLEPGLLHFSWQCRVHAGCWRDFLQLKAHLLWCCVSLVTQRFVAATSRSQKTFSSSPESGDILRFIASCSGFIQGGSAWRESAASAFFGKGPKEISTGTALGLPQSTLRFQKKRTKPLKKSQEGGEDLHFSVSTQCVTLTLCRSALVCHPYRIRSDF